ncbi:MAG TPA: hypothetical protein VD905_03680 [Flavobacteriales bacterium]|nr:hypothetical protein [Flavobacteriales bacterium]
MKKSILIVLFAIYSSILQAANFYWVGLSTGLGAGGSSYSRWHNPNCWATTSGGTIHPATFPGPSDDVYFDNGWTDNYPCNGDTIAECNNLYISDGAYVLSGVGLSSPGFTINIHGNLDVSLIPSGMEETFIMTHMHFRNPVSAHINIPNGFMANAYPYQSTIYIENGCELILDGDNTGYGFGPVFIDAGKFNLNGHRFKASQFGGMPGSVMDISNSTIYCGGIFNHLKLIATANANVHMNIVGFCDNGLVVETAGGTLNFDTISMNNVPMTIGWEGLYCDDCYINHLLIDSSRVVAPMVNGHVENVHATASELMQGGSAYNMTIDAFTFEAAGFPHPYWGSYHNLWFSSATTSILDTFNISNGTGMNIFLSAYDGFASLNVDLGDEYCLDSVTVENFSNTGMPLHIGMHGSDLGGNTNVLFDSMWVYQLPGLAWRCQQRQHCEFT